MIDSLVEFIYIIKEFIFSFVDGALAVLQTMVFVIDMFLPNEGVSNWMSILPASLVGIISLSVVLIVIFRIFGR